MSGTGKFWKTRSSDRGQALPFTAGALILEKDIVNLSGTIDSADPQQIKISGLPLGRKVPDSFQVKVGDSPASFDCYNLTDTKTGNGGLSVRFRCHIWQRSPNFRQLRWSKIYANC